MFKALSTLFIVALAACGDAPDTSNNPICTTQANCGQGLVCCNGRCQIPGSSECGGLTDTTDDTSTDTTVPDSTSPTDTEPDADTTVSDADTSDADTSDADTTVNDTDTSPGGLVLVDPGIHTLGGAVGAGGILLLDARLDGRSRVCSGSICVEGGISP